MQPAVARASDVHAPRRFFFCCPPQTDTTTESHVPPLGAPVRDTVVETFRRSASSAPSFSNTPNLRRAVTHAIHVRAHTPDLWPPRPVRTRRRLQTPTEEGARPGSDPLIGRAGSEGQLARPWRSGQARRPRPHSAAAGRAEPVASGVAAYKAQQDRFAHLRLTRRSQSELRLDKRYGEAGTGALVDGSRPQSVPVSTVTRAHVEGAVGHFYGSDGIPMSVAATGGAGLGDDARSQGSAPGTLVYATSAEVLAQPTTVRARIALERSQSLISAGARLFSQPPFFFFYSDIIEWLTIGVAGVAGSGDLFAQVIYPPSIHSTSSVPCH